MNGVVNNVIKNLIKLFINIQLAQPLMFVWKIVMVKMQMEFNSSHKMQYLMLIMLWHLQHNV